MTATATGAATDEAAVGGTPRTVPGRAGQVLAELGGRAVLCGVYDEIGSRIYDDLSRNDTHEVRELIGLVRRRPGPVLELAAGSGRLTLPLLAAGKDVTALELNRPMLDLLSARLREAPERLRGRCTTVRGDMTSFALGRRFGSVVLGTTSISLLDERGRAGLYRAVRDHLAPGGAFLVSTAYASPAYTAASAPDAAHELRMELTGAGGRAYHLHEYWSPAAGTRTVTIHAADLAGDGPVHVCTSTVATLPAGLLEAELAAAGFRLKARHPLAHGSEHHESVLLEAEPRPDRAEEAEEESR
ncbi:daptide-type RiPP biosynthesis methyltransferase [Streptomyces roseolus]|uniref:daptide-type RiPP biosynthesis methyltransferase n=1 Tax=Streptomyces TaxID=1883 RepID=UPI0036E4E3DC